MLRIGRHRKSKPKGELLVTLLFQIPTLSPFKYRKTAPTKIKLFKTIIRGTSESGCEKPNSRVNSFRKRPTIIKKAILNPIEKRTVSITLNLLGFSIFRKMNPGIKVQYKKPMTCLAIGMSKKTTKKNINIEKRTSNNILFGFCVFTL